MYQKKICICSAFVSFILSMLYHFRYIFQIRNIFSDIITFNAAVLGFLMVFFTVLQGVIKTDLFKKMEDFRGGLIDDIFVQIKSLLFGSIILFIYVLLAKILRVTNYPLKVIGVFILFFLVFYLCIGLFYLITDIYDTLVKANKEKIEEN